MYFFFFKQKTAYEMRISDWSSDVCSSDLAIPDPAATKPRRERRVIGLLMSFPRENGFHLFDFGCLPRDDAAAELAYLGVLERGLLAPENCARMVRDHRTQEDRVAARGLSQDEREAPE